MAQKRPRRGSARSAPAEDAPASTAGTASTSASGKQWPPPLPLEARREVRPYIYAGFDFAMAGLYALLLIQSPTRHALHASLAWGTVAAISIAGAGMLWRSRWGWRAAAAACALQLALAVLLLVLIVLSASFLSGVYGAMGKGAATMSLLAGALVLELVALLPAFQLKFLMTRAGRRHYAAARPAR